MATTKNTDAEIKETVVATEAVTEKAAPEAEAEVKAEPAKKRGKKNVEKKPEVAVKPAKATKNSKAVKAEKIEKPAKTAKSVAKKKTLSYDEIVAKAQKKAQAANITRIKYPIAVNFEVSGVCDGVFYILIADGAISVEKFKYNDYDVSIRADAEELAKIFDGRLNFYDALADDLHVDGNLKKAVLFINAVL